MRFAAFILYLVLFSSIDLYAQDMEDYTGSWQGEIEDVKTFNFRVEISHLHSNKSLLRISNKGEIILRKFNNAVGNLINISVNENLSFEGILSDLGNEINGFIKSGILLYHIKLRKTKTNSFVGDWNILMVDKLLSKNVYLSLENGSGDDYQAYPILGDNRFTGTWCSNFEKKNDTISFSDIKTGLHFKGRLETGEIQLGIYLGNSLITTIILTKSQSDWSIGRFISNENLLESANPHLREMEELILIDSLPNTHSIVFSKGGNTIYERNFDGYNALIPHDTRSVSKSISSAVVGIALDKSLFVNVEQSMFDLLPEHNQIYRDSLKSKIDIQSLLTMSSGLDAIDFGIDRQSVASENNYQNSPDWTKTILNAPMVYEPNTHANYGSANPHLLGLVMGAVVSESLELFIDKNLFEKLDISNYIIQTDEKGMPYLGGGMYLRPRDMLKFGQLYLQKGQWKNEQIISEKWVENSIKSYRPLENTMDKNGYGYLWWHNSYQSNGKMFKSIEARGTGGQYIFILPSLDAVVVITSGNYRNGKFQQPELILEKYILPYLNK